MSNEPTEPVPAAWFRREWVCKTPESWECTHNDRHDANRGCGYYWRASFSEQRWETLQRTQRIARERELEMVRAIRDNLPGITSVGFHCDGSKPCQVCSGDD
jgi:hypothetical protein